MARVKQKEEPSDAALFESRATAYLAAKAEADRYAKRATALANDLKARLDSLGTELDGGHFRFSFASPIGDFAGLKKERRVSRTLDEDRALEILQQRGVADQATKTITVIDEDAVFALLAEEVLTEKDIEEMFPAKVTWALKVEKTK